MKVFIFKFIDPDNAGNMVEHALLLLKLANGARSWFSLLTAIWRSWQRWKHCSRRITPPAETGVTIDQSSIATDPF